jgi:hypothetical protein
MSQSVTSSWDGRRKSVRAFTEQGIAMLSSVLRSRRAIDVNVAIMRAFVRLRRALLEHRELAERVAELERKFIGHDERIGAVFEAIRQLLEPGPEAGRRSASASAGLRRSDRRVRVSTAMV